MDMQDAAAFNTAQKRAAMWKRTLIGRLGDFRGLIDDNAEDMVIGAKLREVQSAALEWTQARKRVMEMAYDESVDF